MSGGQLYDLKLYVAGQSPRSVRAIENLRAVCDEHLAGRYTVEVIDLLSDFPDIGLSVRGTIRDKHVQFGRDGFVIRYRRTNRQVTILRIFHSRQDR